MHLNRLMRVLCVLALCTRSALADEPADEASARFQRGIELTDEGDLRSAAEHFEEAYRLRPHPVVLFNLGQAYSTLGRPADALRVLRLYLKTSAAEDAEGRREAETLLQFNEQRVGRLELYVEPEGAAVEIDGHAIGTAPFRETLELGIGRHSVVAMHEGYQPAIEKIDVRRGERAVVTIRLPSIIDNTKTTAGFAPLAPIPAPPTQKPEQDTARVGANQRFWALATGGAGISLIGAALVTYALNAPRYETWQNDRDELEAELTAKGGTKDLLDRNAALTSQAVEIQRVDDIALSLGIIGGALLSTAGVLWFTAPRPAKHQTAALMAGPQRIEMRILF